MEYYELITPTMYEDTSMQRNGRNKINYPSTTQIFNENAYCNCLWSSLFLHVVRRRQTIRSKLESDIPSK